MLEEDEIKVLEEVYGKEWYKKWNYEKEDLKEIRNWILYHKKSLENLYDFISSKKAIKKSSKKSHQKDVILYEIKKLII